MNRNTRRRQVRQRQAGRSARPIPHWTELQQTTLRELEDLAAEHGLSVEPGKMAHARALNAHRKAIQEADHGA